ncbi:MAG: flagellar protein FlbB [Treponema sp.]|jgi:flagellar protein FlbB|nr:flagellar protein FlbB [Treponema sp.]
MVGRIIVLILLIAVMAFGGLMWLDYLNVIDAKTVLVPVYRLFGKEGRTQVKSVDDESLSLDAERLAVRLEALELQFKEMEKQEQEIQRRRGEIEQMAEELDERKNSLDERENSINAEAEQADIRTRNVEQNARYLNGMPPQAAVGIIAAMDDQDAIDVFRKTEEIAQAEGTTSIVSYWLSLLPPERAAELQRKMTGRPSRLN